MIKMQIAGIQIEVPEGEVSFYKRAGYSVVIEKPVPVETVEETNEPVPVEKKSKK